MPDPVNPPSQKKPIPENPVKPDQMRIYKKCPHLFWFCSLAIFQIWTFWNVMQQKRQKLLLTVPKSLPNRPKTSETDTNAVFI